MKSTSGSSFLLPSWRGKFPAVREWVHLDLANRAPMPDVAYAAVLQQLDDLHRDRGDKDAWKAIVEECRTRAAQLLRAHASEIAFMRNTSEALNAIAQAIPWSGGDNVVVHAGEHPNNLYPWRHLRRRGVEVREILVTDRPVEAADYFALIDKHTKAVAMSIVSYSTGQRLPVEAVASRCQEIGALLVTDGVQAVGILDLDVRCLGVSALACGSQKGLMSGYGAAFLYVDRRATQSLVPTYAARASLASSRMANGDLDFAAGARRFEIGNHNYAALFAVNASLNLVLQTGIAEIERGVRARAQFLLEEARRAGLRSAMPLAEEQRSGIVVLAHHQAERAAAGLRDRHILVTANEFGLRAAPHLYNDENDLVTFIRALSEF